MPLTLSKSVTVSSEQELVAATRAGDDRAFEELYSQYRDRILAFIAAKVHDHGRAEDIAQDVFISALRRLRQTDRPIQFKPWIYEIAKNAAIDEFRRGSRAREVPLEADGELVTDRQPMLTIVPTPPVVMEGKQRLDDLRGAFGGLSANHHRLLVMRELQGMSYDEIGDELDMSRQMVESGLFRARRKLSEEYRELATGRRCEQIQTAIASGEMRSIASLGIRERRRVGRHLAHCQPCRRHALAAGVDSALVAPRGIAAKIAALFPFPVAALRWPFHGGAGARASAAGSRRLAAGAVPRAGAAAGQAASGAPLGSAAAAVAVLAIAGVGGGFVHGFGPAGAPRHRLTITPAAERSAAAALPSSIGTGADSSVGLSAAKAAWARSGAAIAFAPAGIRAPRATRRHASSARHRAPDAPEPPASAAAPPPIHSMPGTPTVVPVVVRATTPTIQAIGTELGAVQSLAGATLRRTVKSVHRTVAGPLGAAASGAANAVAPLSAATAPLAPVTAAVGAQAGAAVTQAVGQAPAAVTGAAGAVARSLFSH